MNTETNKVRESLISQSAGVIGQAAFQGAIGARKQWGTVVDAVQEPLKEITDTAHAQATIKGLQAKAAEAYAGAIHANSAKEMLWLRPLGKAGKALNPPEGMEEARPFNVTSVGQYLATIARNVGKVGVIGVPKPGERLPDYEARIEAATNTDASRGTQNNGTASAPEAAKPETPASVLSAPAAAVVAAVDDAQGTAEPFVKAFATVAKDAAADGAGLAFWQHMAAEAATWWKSRKMAQAIIEPDADDDGEGADVVQEALAG